MSSDLNNKQIQLYSNLINNIREYKTQIEKLKNINIFSGDKKYTNDLSKAIITFNQNIKTFIRKNYLYSKELLNKLDKSSQELKDLKSNKIHENTLFKRFLRIFMGDSPESINLKNKIPKWFDTIDDDSIKKNIADSLTNQDIDLLNPESKKILIKWLNSLKLTGGKNIQYGGELTVLSILNIINNVFNNLILIVEIIQIIPNKSELKKKIKSAIETINNINQNLFTILLTKDYIKTIDISLTNLKSIDDLYDS